MRRIGILTSGGDAPGMNAAVRAATRAGLAQGWEVFGVRNGCAGLIADSMEPLRARDVGGIIQRGGTVLGSARCPEFREDAGRAKALRNLARREIDALLVIGGNGSQTGSSLLALDGFPVVGVASTIDNDIYGTDVAIGVDTAVNVTLEAIDRLRTTGASHQRAFLVETMGRHCGYIAPTFEVYWAGVEAVRAKGYAVDTGHYVKGVTTLSAPVLDAGGEAVMAISAVGFSAQLSGGKLRRLARDLRAGAAQLSQALSGGGLQSQRVA